jgi:hypothetical protein
MILLKRNFWVSVLRLIVVLITELALCLFVLVLIFFIYMATEWESLNTSTATIFYKIFLSAPVCIYNAKQLIISYRKGNYIESFGFIGITALYCLFVLTLAGGGR